MVRALVGDRNTLSSSSLDSSLRGDAALSQAVESGDRKQWTREHAAVIMLAFETFMQRLVGCLLADPQPQSLFSRLAVFYC